MEYFLDRKTISSFLNFFNHIQKTNKKRFWWIYWREKKEIDE